MEKFRKKLGFVGAGAIAEAWIERLVKYGLCEPEGLLATDVRPEAPAKLREKWGIQTSANNAAAAEFADIVVLAVPPPATLPVLREIRERFQKGQIVISLAAAVPVARLEAEVANVAVVRVMPNLPALVGAAFNLVVFSSEATVEERLEVAGLLNLLGQWKEVEDASIDTWCALCAVSPTFLLPLMEALAKAARAGGMDEAEALRGVAQTFAGTSRMVLESGRTPEELKQMIGLRPLKEEAACQLFSEAYAEAMARLKGIGARIGSVVNA